MGIVDGLLQVVSGNKKLASSVGIAVAAIGGFLQFDSYYAHAADISGLKQAQEQAVVQQRIESRYAMDQIRKQYLQDKVFELNLIEKPTPVQKAMKEKYQMDLEAINGKWVNRETK